MRFFQFFLFGFNHFNLALEIFFYRAHFFSFLFSVLSVFAQNGLSLLYSVFFALNFTVSVFNYLFVIFFQLIEFFFGLKHFFLLYCFAFLLGFFENGDLLLVKYSV